MCNPRVRFRQSDPGDRVRLARPFLRALALVLVADSALAVEPPRPLGDLGRAIGSEAGSGPHGFARLGDRVVFAAQPDDLADRLFVSDGSRSGTNELRALCPPRVPGRITLHHGRPERAYFHAACGDGLRRLWVTDGTVSGTTLLASSPLQELYDDGRSGWAAAGLRGWFEAGQVTYFLWKGEGGSFELWRTGGTPTSTLRVWDPAGSGGELLGGLGHSDGSAILLTGSILDQISFWSLDGPQGGVSQLRSIPSAFGGLSFSLFGDIGSRLIAWIPAPDYVHSELWASDGTGAGTVRLAELGAHGEVTPFPTDGNALYFVARANGARAIWRTQGTPESTGPIVDISGWSTSHRELVVQGDRLLFLLCTSDGWGGAECSLARAPAAGGVFETFLEDCDGQPCGAIARWSGLQTVGDRTIFRVFAESRTRLFATDGLAPAAELLALSAGVGVVLEEELFFLRSTDDGLSYELWMSNGTSAGTIRLGHGLAPDLLPNYELSPARVNEDRWVVPLRVPAFGSEPWTVGRESDSLSLLADLRVDRPGLLAADRASVTDSPLTFAVQNDRWRTEIVALDAGGSQFSRQFEVPPTDPYDSAPPIQRFRQFEVGEEWLFFERAPYDDDSIDVAGRQIYRFRPETGELFPVFDDPALTGNGAVGAELVESAAGPLFLGVKEYHSQPAGGASKLLVYRWNATVNAPEIFLVLPASSGSSLGANRGHWFLVEDGRRVVAIDLETMERRVLIERDEAFGARLLSLEHGAAFLIFSSEESSVEFLTSDGTVGGTNFHGLYGLSSSIICSGYLDYSRPRADRAMLLAFGNTCGGATLWITDGSVERTLELRNDDWNLSVSNGVTFRGEHYFLARHRDPYPAPIRYLLWRTDGSPAGTVPVVELPAPSDDFHVSQASFAAGGRAIQFGWADAVHGAEPWRSDGTPSGTQLAADLEPGLGSSNPRGFVTLRDQVLFTASTVAQGTELWQADGGEGSPVIVADLYPGPESSTPTLVTVAGERLYYLADDGVVGRELWEVTRPSMAPCEPAATTLCLAGGRFRARAVSRDFAGKSAPAKAEILGSDSGYLWFFEPGNPEVLVKVVDACAVPGSGNFWTYVSGLTNLEVELELTDTVSGERSSIRRAMGEPFGPRFDTGSFSVCTAVGGDVAGFAGRAVPDAAASILPLLGGRFEATVGWAAMGGASGRAAAVPISDVSGYFWFFSPALAEVVVKLSDACDIPDFESFWLFVAGLTDVEVELSVVDTWTGERWRRETGLGEPFPSILDSRAFAGCAALPRPLLGK